MKTVTAALITLACALAGTPALAQDNVARLRAESSQDFRIVIPAFVRVTQRSDPVEVAVGASDVARGYVDVEDATSLMLVSNSPAGYTVRVGYDEKLVSRVAVRMNGNTLEMRAPGTEHHVASPRVTDKAVRVGYRLFLAPGAAPGSYRWPVALDFAPASI